MDLQQITPDQVVYWQWDFVRINATIAYTWGVMAFMVIGSWLITRNLTLDREIPRWQNLFEMVIDNTREQIREISHDKPGIYLPFIATLFLFILICNLLTIVPGFIPPTGSLSTTAALAICVFIAVPIYGISQKGFGGYFKHFLRPTPFMLPFNIIGELSRTLSLAVRLFGNVMSGTKIIAILLAIAPLFFPIVMNLLGLLTGVIQAYIFAVLAMVYIASATRAHQEEESEQ